ncbi:hypothetical protein SS50377_21649 [Spironucleus salmonicida]|uniref:B-box zinc finger domain-containing protein n=1 Tax=Spironucleus salmonicida TaxID=348837 RepID=V6LNT3_9EUKA|nr:hypothetical protein SS50377_21649 [Spironucleus salmonicida]|eukprot:EST45376.1 hypothetical protein SS50377_14707 [Spironucleus salmonicida]
MHPELPDFPFGSYCDFCFQASDEFSEFDCGHAFCAACCAEALDCSCPFDFQPLQNARVRPAERCKNCSATAAVACRACDTLLCEKCDLEIHSISVFHSHVRERINEQIQPLACMCDTHQSALQSSVLVKSNFEVQKITHFCPELNQLLCEFCSENNAYCNYTILPINLAYDIMKANTQELSNLTRELVVSLKNQFHKVLSINEVNKNLLSLSLDQAKSLKVELIRKVENRFKSLENELQNVFEKRENSASILLKKLSKKALSLSNLAISSEKLSAHRKLECFLLESAEIGAVLSEKITQENQFKFDFSLPLSNRFPTIENGIQVSQIALKSEDLKAESSVARPSCCAKCGILICKSELELIAKKRKGALLGVENQFLIHIFLDYKSGDAGSRWVRCGGCMSEIGRFSEGPGGKFSEGLLFLSKNGVK